MTSPWQGRTLLVVVAHPDDETFGLGSGIAGAAAGGAHVVVACATRGEAGELRPGDELGGRPLADARVEELHAAAATLGAAEVVLLDFADSGMAGDAAETTLFGAPFAAVVAAVGAVVERVDPDVVVTLDESGGDGHRDHVRIAEATIEAVRQRATAATLYSWCVVRSLLTRWLDHQRATSPDRAYLKLHPAARGRPEEEVTTVVEAAALVALRQQAIALHGSQVSP